MNVLFTSIRYTIIQEFIHNRNENMHAVNSTNKSDALMQNNHILPVII